MSVLWQEWQVRGIITETWKVCVSTFGHLRRIDPHCAAAGLMSTVRPASNELRPVAAVFHQPCALSLQHPIMPRTHGRSVTQASSTGFLVTHQCAATQSEKDSAKMSSSRLHSWKHCDSDVLVSSGLYPLSFNALCVTGQAAAQALLSHGMKISTACPHLVSNWQNLLF